MKPPQEPDAVARYYDANTRLFLRIGTSRHQHVIHRGLWAPGVTSTDAAADYIHVHLAAWLRRQGYHSPAQILDLGCGVGGTLFSLARQFPDAGCTGVTVSGEQVDLARRLAAQEGLAHRCQFLRADFRHLDGLSLTADVMVAIESFIHCADPTAFLASGRTHLQPTGVLCIVDDFLRQDRALLSAAANRQLDAFQEGWQAPGLCTQAALESLAAEQGFTLCLAEDLTGFIRTRRLRDHGVRIAATFAGLPGLRERPFWKNLRGGNALNHAIRHGLIEYRLLCFRHA